MAQVWYGGLTLPVPVASLWTSDRVALEPAGTGPLEGDRSADVVVVGGGAAGLTIAVRLLERGAEVVLLERSRIGAGVTGGSTAKLTALHGVVSSTLRRQHGQDVATAYLEANRVALADIRTTVERYGIACSLTDAAAIDYATTEAGVKQLEDELTTARAAGLPAERRRDLELPFPVLGAIVLADQAHVHPYRWCAGLAGVLGGQVHEGTAVVRIDEDDRGCTAVTENGGSVRAEHAVIATQAPIVDPRYLTMRCRPHRSYALAAQIEGTPPEDMYLSVDEPVRSLRPAQVDGTTYLVVAGEGHPVADERDARACVTTLEAWTRQHFPVLSVEHRWAAHDQIPSDGLPFIGRLTPGSRRWVATGFQKWGLTTGGVAAAIVSAGVDGDDHPAASIFDPTRLRSTTTGRLATDIVRVANRYIGDHLRVWGSRAAVAEQLAALEAGDGVVVRSGRGGAAVHRDADGELHAVSAVCTHEGCLVRFNRAQTSWDCPCHGSRFSVDGGVLSGPAVQALPAIELPPERSR